MPTTLRNGRKVPNQDDDETVQELNMDSIDLRRERLSSKPSPYLLLVYPVILAAGSLFSILSPVASPDSSSPSPNYFAGKHNVINVYFVKMGWLWTTLAFVLLQLTTRPPRSSTQKHYIQATTRYTIITFAWFLTTQWFFGPALIDRSFTITGGHCEGPPPHELSDMKQAIELPTIQSATTCKINGGRWRGGHDISGHIFMLVLSSAFLLYELYISDTHSTHPTVSPAAAAKLAHDMTEEERNAVGGWESEGVAKFRLYTRYLLYAVVSLDMWMIMMTAIWFHTWLEKLSGLILAAGTTWSVYFLPELVPAWGNIVGVSV